MKKYRMTLEFTAENGEEARSYARSRETDLSVNSDYPVTLVRLDEEYYTWCPVRLEEAPSDG